MKAAVVFWSGTGNTEAMANAITEGARGAGAEVELLNCADFKPERLKEFNAFAFGCPAMGAEVLEEDEFEPMFTSIENQLSDCRVVLFGSYGWGDGEWMRSWEERCANAGISLAAQSVICCEEPDEEGLNQCRDLGAALA